MTCTATLSTVELTNQYQRIRPFATRPRTAVAGIIISTMNSFGTRNCQFRKHQDLRNLLRQHAVVECGRSDCGSHCQSQSGRRYAAGATVGLQRSGTAYTDFIPVEWWTDTFPNPQTLNPVYAAIENAVALGFMLLNVVATVAPHINSGYNTDSLTWHGNSGAIIVGAAGFRWRYLY